jgi:hypothetical protein
VCLSGSVVICCDAWLGNDDVVVGRALREGVGDLGGYCGGGLQFRVGLKKSRVVSVSAQAGGIRELILGG